MKNKLTLFQVDAFSNKVFSGNPAAVIIIEKELPVDLMQNIAAENNLSETAFVVSKNGKFRIRWFTPTTEVNLCGHATLASAFVLFNFLNIQQESIEFQSKSGILKVTKDKDLLLMNFPSDVLNKVIITLDIEKALGKKPIELYRGLEDYLAVYESEEDIASLSPNMELLKEIPCRGFIVTSKSEKYDFVSRFFGPGAGILEDPVTGSAHTMLVPYWSKVLGKDIFHVKQISKRGGELYCKNLSENRIEIGGRASLYLKGEIYI
ncbi:MAG: PhzF family phenazine biosynthesis protein [Leptospiraceae bacterium]|nr:PhzF family phenazine biosynthesis protein [Leptospiraceae bacterium]